MTHPLQPQYSCSYTSSSRAPLGGPPIICSLCRACSSILILSSSRARLACSSSNRISSFTSKYQPAGGRSCLIYRLRFAEQQAPRSSGATFGKQTLVVGDQFLHLLHQLRHLRVVLRVLASVVKGVVPAGQQFPGSTEALGSTDDGQAWFI